MVVGFIIVILTSLIERFPALGKVVALLFAVYIVIGVTYALFSFFTTAPELGYDDPYYEDHGGDYGPMAR